MREISLFQLSLISILTIVNLSIFVLTIITNRIKIVSFLTMWSYLVNTIYLTILFICDWYLYFSKTEKLEYIISSFFRNTFSKIGCSLTYTITILYWLLVVLGPIIMRFETSNFLIIFFHIYLHGVITVFVLLEIVFFEHKRLDSNNLDVLILTIIYVCYLVLALISQYVFNLPPYQFMDMVKPYQLISPIMVFYIIIINSYQVHIWIIKKKNDLFPTNTEVEIEQVKEGLLNNDQS